MMLQISNVYARHGLLEAVRGISMSIDQGETVALVGANGAGKTTLLRAIAGAHAISSGHVRLRDQEITGLRAFERVRLGLSLVPEGRKMFSSMTVAENLSLGSMSRRFGYWSIDHVVEIFPNLKKSLHQKTGHLSGGEQQATAIGRALMSNPDVLLLDEISLGLSPLTVDRVYEAVGKLKTMGTTMLLVEQDLSRAMAVADRVVCVLEGQVSLEGASKDLDRQQITDAYFGLKRPARSGVRA